MSESEKEKKIFLSYCGSRDQELLTGRKKMTLGDMERFSFLTEFFGLESYGLNLWKEFGDEVEEPLDALIKLLDEEIELTESSTQKFIQQVIEEHFERFTGKGEMSMGTARTIAVQVSEELFQRLKTVIAKKGMKQKDFLIQIIEEALEKAEAEWQNKDSIEKTYHYRNDKAVRDAMQIVATENEYHPVRNWLKSLEWDGIERVRYALPHFLGTSGSD